MNEIHHILRLNFTLKIIELDCLSSSKGRKENDAKDSCRKEYVGKSE